jgi:hypothetical protein
MYANPGYVMIDACPTFDVVRIGTMIIRMFWTFWTFLFCKAMRFPRLLMLLHNTLTKESHAKLCETNAFQEKRI